MKKIFILFCFLLTVAVFGETVKIGYFQLAPYVITDVDGGKPSGIIVDFWEEYIAPSMGIELEWIGPYPFSRMERMLETGEIDTVFLMIKTPPRLEKFIFAEKPFLFMQPGLTLRKDDPMPPIASLEDIYGLKLAYIDGANLPPYLINENIILDRTTQADYKTVNFQKLLRNRVDAILDLNMLSNPYEAEARGLSDQIRMIPLPVDPTPMFAAFANTASGRRYFDSYMAAISQVPADTIENLISQYSN